MYWSFGHLMSVSDVLTAGAVVRVEVRAVIPLADPRLVALATQAIVEPVHGRDPGGVVVHTVDGEDGDLRLLGTLATVSLGVPCGRCGNAVVVITTGFEVFEAHYRGVWSTAGDVREELLFRERFAVCAARFAGKEPVDGEFLVSLGRSDPLKEVRDSVLELVVVHRCEAGARNDGLETLGSRRSAHRRRRADVGVTDHSDSAVRPLLVGDPFDDVFDVRAVLLAEVIETTTRHAGAAQVHEDDRVATRREVAGESERLVRRDTAGLLLGVDPRRKVRGLRPREDPRARAVGDRAVVRARLEDDRVLLVGLGPDDLEVNANVSGEGSLVLGLAHQGAELRTHRLALGTLETIDLVVAVLDLAHLALELLCSRRPCRRCTHPSGPQRFACALWMRLPALLVRGTESGGPR